MLIWIEIRDEDWNQDWDRIFIDRNFLAGKLLGLVIIQKKNPFIRNPYFEQIYHLVEKSIL